MLERRIAEGRPPPDVWRKADERRAKHAETAHAAGWYVSATPDLACEPAPGRHDPSAGRALRPVAIGDPLILRLVRLPPAAAATAPARDELARRPINAK